MSPVTRLRAIPAVVLLTLLVGFTSACGGGSSSTTTGSGTGTSTSASPTMTDSSESPSTSPSADAQCASAGTRHFQKTRLVADLGGAYALFHRYLYKPYQAGTFKKGASGRTFAIVKATAAGAAITKLLKNAAENAQADPTLCKYVPSMETISSGLKGLTSKIIGGAATAGDLASTEGLFSKLKGVIGFSDSKVPGL